VGGSGGAGAGGAGGAAGSGATAKLDGSILFRGLGEGIAYSVDLFATPQPAPTEVAHGDGHCDVHPTGGGDADLSLPPSSGTLDLGATVTATSGATAFTAPVSSAGFQYVFTQAGVDAFGKTWTLTNSGSSQGLAATTLAMVHVPTAVVTVVPPPGGVSLDTTTGPLVLQWTGGEGAQTMHVNLGSSKVQIDCYLPPMATSFAVPADLQKQLDPQVVPIIFAETVALVPIGARTVRVRVTSDNLD
jgi:hypothetical protein